MEKEETRHYRLIRIIEQFSEGRLHWIESVADILNCPKRFILHKDEFMSYDWFLAFGDALLIHHAFSLEPFTKDKFEYAIVSTAKLVEINADFAPKGFRGHDVIIKNTKFSLKTQADKSIKEHSIWISKYMELGKGDWSNDPKQLIGLVESFLNHLQESDRILILRCLDKAPSWRYEMVEIPKKLLERSANGIIEMKSDSKQMPKPGYCTVKDNSGIIDFQLYFDGGSERKLQIKSLRKDLCNVIAEWIFKPNPSSNE
ncbi:MAG TPA: hypothetical protein VFG10_02735 [Saprospiraceae bacterium]|nr:hypothetical protein [Saprospiraceae bacterium]